MWGIKMASRPSYLHVWCIDFIEHNEQNIVPRKGTHRLGILGTGADVTSHRDDLCTAFPYPAIDVILHLIAFAFNALKNLDLLHGRRHKSWLVGKLSSHIYNTDY